MYELIQRLIAFKYACKINHWCATEYATHLQCDRLAEDIDTWVDSISESYFMAADEKNIFQANVLAPSMIDRNLVQMCESIINYLEQLQSNEPLNEGMISLLSAIEEGMLNKLALARLS